MLMFFDLLYFKQILFLLPQTKCKKEEIFERSQEDYSYYTKKLSYLSMLNPYTNFL